MNDSYMLHEGIGLLNSSYCWIWWIFCTPDLRAASKIQSATTRTSAVPTHPLRNRHFSISPNVTSITFMPVSCCVIQHPSRGEAKQLAKLPHYQSWRPPVNRPFYCFLVSPAPTSNALASLEVTMWNRSEGFHMIYDVWSRQHGSLTHGVR